MPSVPATCSIPMVLHELTVLIVFVLCEEYKLWVVERVGGWTTDALYTRKYEGKSLNNRNFIITFLQEYLQKLFVSYFST